MPQTLTEILNNINTTIVNPLILLMFAVAMVVFVWGIVQFISSEERGEGRQKGKRNLLYGIIGLFIMVSVFGIIRIIGATFGLEFGNLYIFDGTVEDVQFDDDDNSGFFEDEIRDSDFDDEFERTTPDGEII